MNSLDSNIFGDKKLKDLFQEIYENQKKTSKQITGLIKELKPLVKDIGDATLIVPLLKEYLEIGVKNDEQLIKMANIIQRCIDGGKKDGEGNVLFSQEDIDQLQEIAKDIKPEEKKDGN